MLIFLYPGLQLSKLIVVKFVVQQKFRYVFIFQITVNFVYDDSKLHKPSTVTFEWIQICVFY